MMTYQRTGKVQQKTENKDSKSSEQSDPPPQKKQGVRVNGIQQVIDMLRVADAPFRESLLSRIAAQDRSLAIELRRKLGL
jgi:hypothetical protein